MSDAAAAQTIDEAAGRILQPGTTCWRLARAERLALIVDAADYFATLKAAIARARHAIYLIGWDFDTRIALEPGDGSDGGPGTPTGAGARFEPPRFLRPGDVVEVEVPGIGLLRNGVADER